MSTKNIVTGRLPVNRTQVRTRHILTSYPVHSYPPRRCYRKIYDATAAENPFDQRRRLSGRLRQQRADPSQPVGLLPVIRRSESDCAGPGVDPELPRHLREPAAGQGPAERIAAERVAI